MASFRFKPLKLVDRIYGFLTQQTAPTSVDIASPVQLVHDVSRGAESYAGFVGDPLEYGWVGYEDAIAAAGAGNYYGQVTPTAAAISTLIGLSSPSLIDQSAVDLYYVGMGFSVNVGIDDVQAWLVRQSTHLRGVTRTYFQALDSWDEFKLMAPVSYPNYVGPIDFDRTERQSPVLIPWGSTILLNANFLAAGTMYWTPIFHLVRKGGAPRGTP